MNNIIEKAKKLLALKDHAGTEGEAQAAAFALGQLLDKHRISMTELEILGESATECAEPDQENPLLEFSKLPTWKRALVSVLCTHYGVVWWRHLKFSKYTTSWKRVNTSQIFLCGRQSDMQMVRYMFAWIMAEASRISIPECSGKGKRYSSSWLLGFVDGINKQLLAARVVVTENATPTAGLVLYKRVDESREALLRALKVKTTSIPAYRSDAQAREEGCRRGEQQHLGNSLDTVAHRTLPAGKQP